MVFIEEAIDLLFEGATSITEEAAASILKQHVLRSAVLLADGELKFGWVVPLKANYRADKRYERQPVVHLSELWVQNGSGYRSKDRSITRGKYVPKCGWHTLTQYARQSDAVLSLK